jgi:hypothetical protein
VCFDKPVLSFPQTARHPVTFADETVPHKKLRTLKKVIQSEEVIQSVRFGTLSL